MAYKMAYEVVVCKKQNGSISASWRYCKPCNEKTTRFLDCNFIFFYFFLRLLGTFAAPLPRSQPALYTAMPHILFCVKAHWRDSQKASPHEPLPPPAGPQFQTQ